MYKGFIVANLLLIFALVGGCASIDWKYVATPAETQAFIANKPLELQPFFKTLYEDGERNAVLNEDRLGLAAFESGHYAIAERALDDAVARIDAVYAQNLQAEEARSKFHKEKVKDFKGESYERAMTYYYRGLLYLRSGEYDNARAAFLGASRQDKFSEDQIYNEDFGLMDYLAGWASLCMGDQVSAQDHLHRSAAVTPALAPLVQKPGKFLLIMETGYAPKKILSGKYLEVLHFSDDPSNHNMAVHLQRRDKEADTPVLAGDLYYQAITRGGRVVDAINAGKAEFKDDAKTAAAVGNAMTQVGAAMMMSSSRNSRRNRQQEEAGAMVGAAGILISLISSGIAAATTPEADARTWEGLPKQIYLLSLDSPPSGSETLKMRLNSTPTPIPFAVHAQNGGCGFAWTHFPPARQLIPGKQIIAEDTDAERGPANLVFRDRLKAQYKN